MNPKNLCLSRREENNVGSWDLSCERVHDFGPLGDPAINDRPARIHEIAIDDRGTLYLAWNDNHERSSYL